jgi:uncharacterized protein YidB (DUF937 family)
MSGIERLLRLRKPLWGQTASEDFAQTVEEFVAAQGGGAALVVRMEQMGLGPIARSWIAGGAKEPISGQQLHQLCGTGSLRALAAKVDMHPRDLVRRLSQTLPATINQLASAGRVTPPSADHGSVEGLDCRGTWTHEHRHRMLNTRRY